MFILPKAIPQKHANTNNIFHRTEKTDPKFCMELQKTLKSQVMLRKKKQSWRYPALWFQTILQSYSNHGTMVLAQN